MSLRGLSFPVSGTCHRFSSLASSARASDPAFSAQRRNTLAPSTRSRSFALTSSARQGRQILGRITPRRIAIPLPPGSGDGSTGIPKASIWRPIIFCVAFGGGAYAFAAACTNHETSYWTSRLGASSWWRGTRPTDRDLRRAKIAERSKQIPEEIKKLKDRLWFLPPSLVTVFLRCEITLEEWKINAPATVAACHVIGLMTSVLILWKMPRMQGTMRKWWLHRPVLFGGGARKEWENCVTLFTSTLSHQTLAHFGFNSFALFSFGSATYLFLSTTPPQSQLASSTTTPHFYAFLLVGGLFASLGSHLWTNIVRLPRLLKTLTAPGRVSSAQALAAHQAIVPSLGASGALYGALTLVACAFPDSRVSIIFLPFFAFPITYGVGTMVLLDLVGLMRGWRVFDHVAHLSGALFGVFYYQYGRQIWVWTRKKLVISGGR